MSALRVRDRSGTKYKRRARPCMDGQRIVRKNRGTGTPNRLVKAKGSYTRSGLIIDNMLQKYDTKYDYTPGGNISRKKQSAWGVGTEGNSITDVNLSYDNEYKYDSPKPHAVTKAGSTEYTYDLDGRMTGSYDSESKFKRTFTWDEEGRLLKSVDNKHTTDYRYDANGERICKYSDPGETIYASGYYTETDGKKISKHIYIGSTRVASQVMSRTCETSTTLKRENTLYYHTDHLGSSGYVTDKRGNFYEHTEYTSSGESWVNEKVTGNADLPYKYTSKEQDAETGLYYYGARYYDAKLCKFVSPDDRIDGLFSSAGQNMYMYCHGNPIMFNDPDGHGFKEALSWAKTKVQERAQKDAKTIKGLLDKYVFGRKENNGSTQTSAGGIWPLETPKRNTYSGESNNGRRFGEARNGGRIHAGCDLLAPYETGVKSIESGEVIYIGDFYLGTKQLQIKHGNYIVRYGEIKDVVPGLRVGDQVSKGQVVAKVGRFQPDPDHQPNLWYSMLHIEMYGNTSLNISQNPLTDTSNSSNYENVTPRNYQRRRDLLDPTSFLDTLE